MPEPLTPEQKKARRAEINRQNAKKSTGPKSPAGKAVTRLNGLKNGNRAIVIDLSHAPGLALLTGEAAGEYQDMVAEYHRTFAPTNRVEVGIIQRLIDAQWRLLRNARLLSLEMETCLDSARDQKYPGLPPVATSEIHMVVANRMCVDAKYTRQLYREEAALVRLINATHRELNSVRKLNPSPAPPVLPRLEYTGKKQSILDQALAADDFFEQSQTVEKTEETAPAAHDQSQPAGWCYAVEPVAAPPEAETETAGPESSPLAPPADPADARPAVSTTPQAIGNKQPTSKEANDQSQPARSARKLTLVASRAASRPAQPVTPAPLATPESPQLIANNAETPPAAHDQSQPEPPPKTFAAGAHGGPYAGLDLI